MNDGKSSISINQPDSGESETKDNHHNIHNEDETWSRSHLDVIAENYDVTEEKRSRDHSRRDSAIGTSPSHDDSIYNPPDGGYGWIICACAFVHQLIADGHLFCFGVLYMALLDHYGSGKSETAAVGAVLIGTSCMSGPIAGAVVNRYSLRTAGILGSLITTTGLIASCFAPNILVLTITYGLVTGLGLGFLFLTSIVSCNVYFKRRRAFANGVALLGSGCGVFITPPFLTFILDYYGLFGTWLVLAGISLNGCVVGALYRPLPIRQRIKDETFLSDSGLAINSTNHDHHGDNNKGDDNSLLTVNSPTVMDSLHNIPSLVNSTYSIQAPSSKMKDSCTSLHSHKISHLNLSHMDLCYIGSMHTIASTVILPSDTAQMNHNSKFPDANNQLSSCLLAKKCPEIVQKLFKSFSCHLLSSPVEILLILSAMLWTGQSSTHTFLVDYAFSVGITPSQGALLISVVGATNCLGRVPVAILTDNPNIRSVYVYQFGLILGGVSNIIIPFVESYAVLMFLATIFGLSMSCLCSLRPIIVVDNMGIENLAGGFGLVILFQGMAYTIVPPISGAILEATESFKVPFVANGLCFLLGVFVLLPITFRCIRYKK